MDNAAGRVWVKTEGKLPGWVAASGLPLLSDARAVRANDCVICLECDPGTPRQADRVPWFMNRNARKVLSLTKQETERRLQREGLAAQLDKGKTIRERQAHYNRRFTAVVFDLAAVDIRRRLADDTGFINANHRLTEPDDHIRKIAARAAVRAIYLLNLDFGQVDLEINQRGRAVIKAVSPVMTPTDEEGEQRLAATVTAFAQSWAEETKQGVRVTLGADPEFVLLSPEGKIAAASRFFPPQGNAGCDSVVVRGIRRWPLAELRPAPSAEPAAVTANLRRLLAEAAKRTAGERLTWRAGAWPVRGLPLGGHVHLSGAALTGERLRALDNAVALPLRLLEPPSAAARRPRFGALGDFRRQSHGGFEYRTPPSWLVSPRLAKGVLALAKVAAEHARELSCYRPFDDDALRDAFYTDNRPLLQEGAFLFREHLLQTAAYRKYEALIEPLFTAIRRSQTWNETADIRERWGIDK
jgi:hypothetical protein